MFAVAVRNVLPGWWSWVAVELENGFLSPNFIHGISTTKHCGHDQVYILAVLQNQHTFMVLHNTFLFSVSSLIHEVADFLNFASYWLFFFFPNFVILIIFLWTWCIFYCINWNFHEIVFIKVDHYYVRMYSKWVSPEKKGMLKIPFLDGH